MLVQKALQDHEEGQCHARKATGSGGEKGTPDLGGHEGVQVNERCECDMQVCKVLPVTAEPLSRDEQETFPTGHCRGSLGCGQLLLICHWLCQEAQGLCVGLPRALAFISGYRVGRRTVGAASLAASPLHPPRSCNRSSQKPC